MFDLIKLKSTAGTFDGGNALRNRNFATGIPDFTAEDFQY